jgi:hypothetical protein
MDIKKYEHLDPNKVRNCKYRNEKEDAFVKI